MINFKRVVKQKDLNNIKNFNVGEIVYCQENNLSYLFTHENKFVIVFVTTSNIKEDKLTSHECKNCGASINRYKSYNCEYCGTFY
jgi:predicted RNA-binding Zn-ribbon protein involved in translation (DUF1610 family)